MPKKTPSPLSEGARRKLQALVDIIWTTSEANARFEAAIAADDRSYFLTPEAIGEELTSIANNALFRVGLRLHIEADVKPFDWDVETRTIEWLGEGRQMLMRGKVAIGEIGPCGKRNEAERATVIEQSQVLTFTTTDRGTVIVTVELSPEDQQVSAALFGSPVRSVSVFERRPGEPPAHVVAFSGDQIHETSGQLLDGSNAAKFTAGLPDVARAALFGSRLATEAAMWFNLDWRPVGTDHWVDWVMGKELTPFPISL